jgi:hypothetical protein
LADVERCVAGRELRAAAERVGVADQGNFQPAD